MRVVAVSDTHTHHRCVRVSHMASASPAPARHTLYACVAYLTGRGGGVVCVGVMRHAVMGGKHCHHVMGGSAIHLPAGDILLHSGHTRSPLSLGCIPEI